MPPKTKKKSRISKKASCIRKTANTARIKRTQLIDSNTDFKPDVYTEVTSSKYAALVSKIKELDAEDMATHGTKFKHFIFTDIREAAYGAKVIAGFLKAAGFEFRMKHTKRTISRKGKKVETKKGTVQLDESNPPVYGGSNSFALLQSLPLWKTTMPVDIKKRMLTIFNSRPDNIYGELLRIIVLDSKFKEGIDLFDVKYVHLMESPIAPSDLKQAVGRATRFCGQRGLHFIPKRGWPLQVYVYKTILPQQEPFLNPEKPLVGKALQTATNKLFSQKVQIVESVDAHELMLKYSGLDLALQNTTKELTILAILSAVDYDLNYKINNFSSTAQTGGGEMTPEMIQKCSKRKNAMFPFTKLEIFETAKKLGIHLSKKGLRATYCKALKNHPDLYNALYDEIGKNDELGKNEEIESDIKMINASLKFSEFQKQIRKLYEKFAWDSPVIENGCTSSAIVKPGTPVTFTRTQDFVRHYLTPESPFKGLLAWHSVGTGKTCMAVAAATSKFESAGYTILWVTRNALMADVYKNIFGAVCSIPISGEIQKGKEIPSSRSAQLRMLSRQWIKPISYKMFQNALEKKNDLGRMLWKNNESDPLCKTFLIIDEIHKLQDGDLSASEFAEFKVIQNFIHKSYTISGKNSVRPLLMTATPISDSPNELFEILNTLIPKDENRFMNLDEFRRRFTNDIGEISTEGKLYFQERAKGLISYLNREYDPTTFSQPEFHTIVVPAGNVEPPQVHTLAEMCTANDEFVKTQRNILETDLQYDTDLKFAKTKKEETAVRRTYKKSISALNKTRKSILNTCFKKQKDIYKQRAVNMQMSALKSCFKTKKAPKYPTMHEFNQAVENLLSKNDSLNSESVVSVNAVINND